MATTSRAAGPDTAPDTVVASTPQAGLGDAGMVTVESAVALCAVVTMFAILLAGTNMVVDQIRCTDAAREAARLVAMGESDRARSTVNSIAPDGASLTMRKTADAVTVVVSANPIGGVLPGIQVGADAFAVLEPGADGDQG